MYIYLNYQSYKSPTKLPAFLSAPNIVDFNHRDPGGRGGALRRIHPQISPHEVKIHPTFSVHFTNCLRHHTDQWVQR